MKTVLIGEATPEQIAQWKKEHPKGITGFETNDGKVAYFKTPERDVLKMATDAVQNGISEYNEVIAENCFIGGEKTVLTDVKYYNSLGKAMNELAEGVKGKLVKL